MSRTGDDLLSDLNTADEELTPLAVDFLYRDTVTMLAADAGLGKSTVATNIAVNLALGQPIFGRFIVPKPCRVFYLQLEGSYIESKKRLRLIRESQQVAAEERWCVDNLVWEPWDAPLNVLKMDSSDMLLDYISGHGNFDAIIVDPIYMCVAGDFSKSDVATAFVRFSNRLRSTFNCAVLHLHHNHRPKRDERQKLVEEEESFYGSIYLKAHVDVSYAMKKQLGGASHEDLIILTSRKDRNNNVSSLITLDYDPEFYTLKAVSDPDELDVNTKIISTLLKIRKEGRNITTFREISSLCHVSTASLRRFQRHTVSEQFVIFDKVSGNKTLWKIK